MSCGGLAEELSRVLTCPLCLDFFTDPVITECGHDFCRACLTQSWGSGDASCSCPECREPLQPSSLRPNRKLANMAVISKKVRLQEVKGSEGAGSICERHQEPLKLFCREDEAPICVVCDRSKEHREHRVIPAEEAADEYQEKIQAQLQSLGKEKEKLVELKLAEEQREECLDIRRTVSRCQEGQVRQQLELSPGLEWRLRSSYPQMSILKAMEELEGSLTQGPSKVSVTLDADTANPILVLSEDLKRLKCGNIKQSLPDTPERFDARPCVLGRERFTSGRHFWEVEVEKMGEGGWWLVGVVLESLNRKEGFCISPHAKVWAVGKDSSRPDPLLAYTSPQKPLTLPREPRKIRVLLDCEESLVEFFDADTDSLIFTFPPASFSGEGIRPFFCVGTGYCLQC